MLRTAGEEACHDRPTSNHGGSPAANAVVTCGVFMGISKPLCWRQPFTRHWETQWRSNGLDFTKKLAQSLTNPGSSGRDALQSMPSFWDRGSEFKIIMMDPFLEFFFRLQISEWSGSPVGALGLLSYFNPILSSLCRFDPQRLLPDGISVNCHWS